MGENGPGQQHRQNTCARVHRALSKSRDADTLKVLAQIASLKRSENRLPRLAT